jgi:hypothetical protein
LENLLLRQKALQACVAILCQRDLGGVNSTLFKERD